VLDLNATTAAERYWIEMTPVLLLYNTYLTAAEWARSATYEHWRYLTSFGALHRGARETCALCND
jgi:hypothetical protein